MNNQFTFLAICTLLFLSTTAHAQWTLDLETGVAFQGYNKVRIPNKEGTAFDFTKDFQTKGPVIPFRARLGYSLNEKNHFILLYAPLSIKYEGPAPYDISFQDSNFPQGTEVSGDYKFNSYRFTYRRDLVRGMNWIFGVGLTAKIRDARVSLSNEGGLRDWKSDVGFVPLLHIFTEYRYRNYSFYMEGDGLAGGPGRAFDFFLGGRVALSKFVSAKIGYRILEGGANINEVYNFTLVNYASVGILIQL